MTSNNYAPRLAHLLKVELEGPREGLLPDGKDRLFFLLLPLLFLRGGEESVRVNKHRRVCMYSGSRVRLTLESFSRRAEPNLDVVLALLAMSCLTSFTSFSNSPKSRVPLLSTSYFSM